MRPTLGFGCSKSILQLTTCPGFDNLEFEIFEAYVPQCLFYTSVLIVVRTDVIKRHCGTHASKISFEHLQYIS